MTLVPIPGQPEADSVIREVVGRWSIRSITWVRLLENGVPVPTGRNDSPELLDGAVAVHGHEFLTSDEEDIAALIAETLGSYYQETYQFESQGPYITARRLVPGEEFSLDLEVYLY